MKAFIKKHTPAFGLRWLHHNVLHKSYVPAIGRVAPGDFGEVVPFSTAFGYDRGGPVDRYYIENFLEKEAEKIKGRVLEIGDNEYTLLYGGSNVRQSDILHIDESNKAATFIGDLSHAPHVPSNTFDCIVLTQTLHLIYDFKAALETCYRILKPGGTFLLTTPGITPIDKGEWKETWYWSFTDKAVQRLLIETFPGCETDINHFGNVHVATSFLYGLGVQELTKAQLDYVDAQFQVIVTASVTKAR